jgi:hypothetical protein
VSWQCSDRTSGPIDPGAPTGTSGGPGLITVSWHICDCPAAVAASGGGASGHLAVYCDRPGCRSVWYRPKCERGERWVYSRLIPGLPLAAQGLAKSDCATWRAGRRPGSGWPRPVPATPPKPCACWWAPVRRTGQAEGRPLAFWAALPVRATRGRVSDDAAGSPRWPSSAGELFIRGPERRQRRLLSCSPRRFRPRRGGRADRGTGCVGRFRPRSARGWTGRCL